MEHDYYAQISIETLQDLNTFQFSLLKISQVIDLGLKGFDEQERLKNYLSDHDDDSAPSVLFNMSLYSLPYIYGHEDDSDTSSDKKGGFIGFLKRMWTAILNFLKRLFPWFNKKSKDVVKQAKDVKDKFEDLKKDSKKYDMSKMTVDFDKLRAFGVDEYQYENDKNDVNDGGIFKDPGSIGFMHADTNKYVNKRINTAATNAKSKLAAHNGDIDSALKAAPDKVTVLSNMPEWIAKASEITASIIKNKDSDIINLTKSDYNGLTNIRLERVLPINKLTSAQITKLLDDIVLLSNHLTGLNESVAKYINDIDQKLVQIDKADDVNNKDERAKLIEYRKGVTYLATSIGELMTGITHIINSIDKNIIYYLTSNQNTNTTDNNDSK